jgi:hypothetical protein
MGLETEFLLLGWGLVGAIVANALFSDRKRPEGREPVGFWRAMEVFGLWAAAGVGLVAIYFSTKDSGAQVGTMRDQLQTMSGQLDEMQQEGRAWVGPIGVALVSKDRDEPLRVTLSYRNYGKQPAAFTRNSTIGAINQLLAGKQIEELPWWKDPKLFNPRSLCQTSSSSQTLYPADNPGYSVEGGPTKDAQFIVAGDPVSIQSVLAEVTQRHLLYLFYGCLTYVAGGKTQFTSYCFMLDPRTSSNADIYTWRFLTCPYGNDDGELEQQAEKK